LKYATLILLGLVYPGLVFADTAYEALRVIKETRGDPALGQLVEVQGDNGGPQPAAWTVIMKDPAARGGMREVVISDNVIVSERTPLRGIAGKDSYRPINFQRLNLDSDGVFKIVNEQALQRQVGFHTLDYSLTQPDQSGSPIWVVRLFDYMGAPVGQLRISAESGKVLTGLTLDPDARVATGGPSRNPPPTAPMPRQPPAPPEDEPARRPLGGLFGTVERTVVGTANTVRRSTLRVAGTVEEFLTGERTVDRDLDNEKSQ
jgi:hypothetical protein